MQFGSKSRHKGGRCLLRRYDFEFICLSSLLQKVYFVRKASMSLTLADAIVVDHATCVDDLIDVNGILVSRDHTLQRTREPVLINVDAILALKQLFKYKTSKKKEEEEEVVPVKVDSESEDVEESEEEESEEEVADDDDD